MAGDDAENNPEADADHGANIQPYLLKEAEAARFLGVGRNTLTKSRIDGMLMGRPAPDWVNFGRNVRYLRRVLEQWAENAAKQ